RGERALAEERFSDAARDFQKALEAGSERADLAALVEKARDAAREREREEHFRAVLEHFGDDDRGALLAYLSCSDQLRSRLRERLERPVLDWLEEIGAVPSGAKALAAVQAVLALEQARAALDRGEAREALDAVSSHMRMLRGLGEARRCIEQAESQLAAGRRARARELLEAACAAYESARREDAKELLEAIDLGELA
ncbi:MAG: hypothetical protein GY849_23660, partial [Deltaproteobacteria bacterium]|nr:hypothetical protein [Deltaproteobacteria bacterium]